MKFSMKKLIKFGVFFKNFKRQVFEIFIEIFRYCL